MTQAYKPTQARAYTHFRVGDEVMVTSTRNCYAEGIIRAIENPEDLRFGYALVAYTTPWHAHEHLRKSDSIMQAYAHVFEPEDDYCFFHCFINLTLLAHSQENI